MAPSLLTSPRYELQHKNPSSGAGMAIMVAALKGRKMVLDLMGVTDEVRKIPRYHIYIYILANY